MEQNRPAPRRALSPKERRRRHRIRLVRNWTVFLLSCGAVMAVMTGDILWLLPRAYALIAPPTAFEAREYEGGAETDLSDKRLVLVNANLPLTEEPTPELAVADEATGVSLEAEAAASGDAMQAQVLKNFKSKLDRFAKRLDDLDRISVVTLQTAPQIKIIQNADQTIVDKIDTTISTTIPVWKSQMVIALGLSNQRKALDLLRKNASDSAASCAVETPSHTYPSLCIARINPCNSSASSSMTKIFINQPLYMALKYHLPPGTRGC